MVNHFWPYPWAKISIFFLTKLSFFLRCYYTIGVQIERNLRHFLRSFHNYYVISNIIWNKREGILCSGPVWASHLLCILSVVISSFATSEHIYRFLSDLPPKESIVWQTYVCIEKKTLQNIHEYWTGEFCELIKNKNII